MDEVSWGQLLDETYDCGVCAPALFLCSVYSVLKVKSQPGGGCVHPQHLISVDLEVDDNGEMLVIDDELGFICFGPCWFFEQIGLSWHFPVLQSCESPSAVRLLRWCYRCSAHVVPARARAKCLARRTLKCWVFGHLAKVMAELQTWMVLQCWGFGTMCRKWWQNLLPWGLQPVECLEHFAENDDRTSAPVSSKRWVFGHFARWWQTFSLESFKLLSVLDTMPWVMGAFQPQRLHQCECLDTLPNTGKSFTATAVPPSRKRVAGPHGMEGLVVWGVGRWVSPHLNGGKRPHQKEGVTSTFPWL